MVRYYSTYSNVSRGKRKKEKVEEEPAEVTEVPPPLISKELKKRWSYFIRKVYETDPLVCPKCAGEIGIISFIDQLAVIKKRFFNTWACGRNAMHHRIEVPRRKKLLLTFLQPDNLRILAFFQIEGTPSSA